MRKTLWPCILLAMFSGVASHAQMELDIESGYVFSGYNDVRIPNDTGTLFSLTDDLETASNIYYRGRLTYSLDDRHSLSILVAPLTLNAEGTIDRSVRYQAAEFPPHAPLKATYRFDSYRLTYRYTFHRSPSLRLGIGLTAKIRDASITLEGNGIRAEKANTGFVPLLHFQADWNFAERWGLLLSGDAAAASQGRAEDVSVVLRRTLSSSIDVKIGYRILEGGADVDEVYNFTLIHYLAAGLIISL